MSGEGLKAYSGRLFKRELAPNALLFALGAVPTALGAYFGSRHDRLKAEASDGYSAHTGLIVGLGAGALAGILAMASFTALSVA